MREYHWVSSDSHIHNGPERWGDRVPKKFRDRLPKRIELPGGGEAMQDEDGNVTYGGTGHFMGHTPEEFDPTKLYYEKEAGYGLPEQRLKDMDADPGVDAEILFSFTPSAFGLPGRDDNEQAVAVLHAANGHLRGQLLRADPAPPPATLALPAALAETPPALTGIDHGYRPDLYLRCAVTEEGVAELRAFQSQRASEGVAMEWLSGEEARAMSPWITAEIIGALRREVVPLVCTAGTGLISGITLR